MQKLGNESTGESRNLVVRLPDYMFEHIENQGMSKSEFIRFLIEKDMSKPKKKKK